MKSLRIESFENFDQLRVGFSFSGKLKKPKMENNLFPFSGFSGKNGKFLYADGKKNYYLIMLLARIVYRARIIGNARKIGPPDLKHFPFLHNFSF